MQLTEEALAASANSEVDNLANEAIQSTLVDVEAETAEVETEDAAPQQQEEEAQIGVAFCAFQRSYENLEVQPLPATLADLRICAPPQSCCSTTSILQPNAHV